MLRQAAVPAEDAEDLRQDVLTVVCQQIQSFEHNGHAGAFRKWLRTIVLNRLRNHWRQYRATKESNVPDEHLNAVEDPIADMERLWDHEHDRHITETLLKLVEPEFTKSTWIAFCRQVLHGLRAEQVAAELGISPNAALLAKSRVLRRLREESEGLIDSK